MVGASLLYFGSNEEIYRAGTEYPITVSGTLEADAVNGLGLGLTILATIYFCKLEWPYKFYSIACNRVSGITTLSSVYIFLGIGYILSIYTFLIDLELIQGEISGIIRNLDKVGMVAVFISLIKKEQKFRIAKILSLILILFTLSTGVLAFSKSKIVITLFIYVMAMGIRLNKIKLSIITLLILLSLFSMLGGAINYSRVVVGQQQTSLSQRIEIFTIGLNSAVGSGEELTEYSGWNRICYIAPQIAAIEFYNNGNGGSEFALIPWLFIPRFLAPNKPNISLSSTEFYTKITGFDGSATGHGIFASGYYNQGWMGLIFVSIIGGFIFSQTRVLSYCIKSKKTTLLVPFILMALFMAFRVDGSFVADEIGVFIMIFYFFLFLNII